MFLNHSAEDNLFFVMADKYVLYGFETVTLSVNVRILNQNASVVQEGSSLLVWCIKQTQLLDLLLPFLNMFLVYPVSCMWTADEWINISIMYIHKPYRLSHSYMIKRSSNSLLSSLSIVFPESSRLETYSKKNHNHQWWWTYPKMRLLFNKAFTVWVKLSILSRIWEMRSSISSEATSFVVSFSSRLIPSPVSPSFSSSSYQKKEYLIKSTTIESYHHQWKIRNIQMVSRVSETLRFLLPPPFSVIT